MRKILSKEIKYMLKVGINRDSGKRRMEAQNTQTKSSN
jgi:hypothetical protein